MMDVENQNNKKKEEENRNNNEQGGEEDEDNENDGSDPDEDQNDEEDIADDQINNAALNNKKKKAGEDFENYTRSAKILCFLIIIFSIAFAEFLCMFRNICDFQGVEIYALLGQLIIISLFITLILIILIYYFVDGVKKQNIGRVQFPLGIWIFCILLGCGFSFYYYDNIADSDVKEIWDKLTDLSKDFYSNKQGNLKNILEDNLLYVSIYLLVQALLLIGLWVILNNMKEKMPNDFRPPTHIINPGCEKDGFIIFKRRLRNKKKNLEDAEKERKKMEDKRGDIDPLKTTSQFAAQGYNQRNDYDKDQEDRDLNPNREGIFKNQQLSRPYGDQEKRNKNFNNNR